MKYGVTHTSEVSCGLKISIVKVVELHSFYTSKNLIIQAHKVKEQPKLILRIEISHSYTRLNTFQQPNPIPQVFDSSFKKSRLQSVPKLTNPTTTILSNPISLRRCLKCQGLGHIASECPNKKIITHDIQAYDREEKMKKVME